MGDSVILETTFLVDFEREESRGDDGAAHRLLKGHRNLRLYITFTIAGQIAAGPSVDNRQKWEDFIRPFYTLAYNADVGWEYGKIYR